jgi:uncharacterized protein DUF2188
MSALTIHIRYSEAGSWVVEAEDLDAPISRHATATAAEQAAIRHAERVEADILMHDLYTRVRFVRRGGAAHWPSG